GNDTRFSDARTPTAHASTHATGGADALTPADIDAATAAQGELADSALQPTGNGSGLTGLTKTQVGLPNVDNTSDANKPVSTAQASAIAASAFAEEARATLEEMAISQLITKNSVAKMREPAGPGDISTGVSALPIASAGATRLGLSDFTIEITVRRTMWDTGAECVLLDAVSANTGWRLALTSSGCVKLSIGNGSDLTTYAYESTEQIPIINGETIVVQVSVFRSTKVIFMVNGTMLGNMVSCNDGSYDVDIPSNDIIALSDGTTHYAGTVLGVVRVWMRAFTATELMDRYKDESLWVGTAAVAAFRQFDGGSLPTGMSAPRMTPTTAQTVAGESGVVELDLAGEETGTHLLLLSLSGSGLPQPDAGIRVAMRCYVCVPSANEVPMTAFLKVDGTGTDITHGKSYFPVDEWQSLVTSSDANALGTLGSAAFYLAVLNANGDTSWTPPASGQQLIYAKNFYIVFGDYLVNFNTNA
ncbi:MAG: hypothetical protein WC455_28675, partial [Dehalococcoidia bacterium]